MRLIHGGTTKVRGRNSTNDFSVSVRYNSESVGGSSTHSTIKDSDVLVTTSAQVTTLPEITVGYSANIEMEAAQLQCLNTSILTFDAAGKASWVSNGSADIVATVPKVGKKRVTVTSNRVASGTNTTRIGWIAGSLARHIDDAVLAAINNKPVNAYNQNRYSVNNGVDVFTRSNTHILGAVDLTALAATQSWSGWTGGTRATAISPRHVIGANHWFPPLNQNITFVAADGLQVVRQIVSYSRIGSTDIGIGYLNADLPASITPLKILPANYAAYLPSITYTLPVYYDFQPGVIHIADWSRTDYDAYNTGNKKECLMWMPTNQATLPWWLNNGGSGSPVFTIINNEAILLYCVHYRLGTTAYGGPFTSNYITEINAAMSSLGGAYTLQTVDLSGFPAY